MFGIHIARALLSLSAAGLVLVPAQATQIVAESGQIQPSYAALADRVIASPAIIDATIDGVSRLKPKEAPGVAPGRTRYYITADVSALIRGPASMSVQIAYLADLPLDSRGKQPRLKKARVLLFARPVAGRPGEIQLTALDAMQPWSPELDSRVRGIVREMLATDAPPAITAVGNAFHVAGSLPGEGETQIFLNTADSRPVSLSILRRPGETPRWAVALSEIVDEAAAAPQRDTLLWYRLACGLPPVLPERSVASMEAADAAIAREDYRFVVQTLGPCRR